MAHHGPSPFDDLGATGKFPEGHLTDDDEGEIKIAIGLKDGKVVMDFGKPVHWIGFTREQALDIATSLIKQVSKTEPDCEKES